MDVRYYRVSTCAPALQLCLFVVAGVFSCELTVAHAFQSCLNIKHAVTSRPFSKWDKVWKPFAHYVYSMSAIILSWKFQLLFKLHPMLRINVMSLIFYVSHRWNARAVLGNACARKRRRKMRSKCLWVCRFHDITSLLTQSEIKFRDTSDNLE